MTAVLGFSPVMISCSAMISGIISRARSVILIVIVLFGPVSVGFITITITFIVGYVAD